MENMDKGLTVPKWVLINRPKILQMPQNSSTQAQKFGISMKKRLHWASVVHDVVQVNHIQNIFLIHAKNLMRVCTCLSMFHMQKFCVKFLKEKNIKMWK